MLDLKVWVPIEKDQVPKNSKIMTTKWVMKKKADGTKMDPGGDFASIVC